MGKKKKKIKTYNPIAVAHSKRKGAGSGTHRNKPLEIKKGLYQKHKKPHDPEGD
jgi:hypothetical protein